MTRDKELPTWDVIERNVVDQLDGARVAASNAGEWARSDWHPDSDLPPNLGDRRRAVAQAVARIEEAVEQAKNSLVDLRTVRKEDSR